MSRKGKSIAKNMVAMPPVLGGNTGVPMPRPTSVPSPKTGRPISMGAGNNKIAESAFMRQIAARMKSHLYKDAVGWMHDTINPLWNISSRQAQMIYDFARSGNYAQIEYLYNEIENCSPVFSVCVTRRTGALSELGWKIVRSDERLTRGADAALVKEQIECLETAIAKIDNLPDFLEHFALSAFRGFSVASIWKKPDGTPYHLENLDHWNICLDKRNDRWLWNPGAVSFMNPTLSSSGMTPIDPSESIAIRRKREIDWPAMKIFLRESIGERDYGRFMETYGLPPVIITMPDLTNKEDQEAYVEAAASVFEGRSGVIPFGSQVNFASESRGVNPFTDFIDHQMKMYVLLSTGGTLTSLTEATGIGSGASETQMDTWKQIVRADVRMVSNAINQQICKPILEKEFKGKPILGEFKLDTEPPMTAKEVAELASSFSSAGFEMDAAELSQIAGFTLRKKDEGGGMRYNADTPTAPASSSLTSPGTTVQAKEPVVVAKPAMPTGPTGDLGPQDIGLNNVTVTPTTGPTGKEMRVEPPKTHRVASVTLGGVSIPPAKETPVGANLSDVGDADAVSPQAEAIGERLVESLQADFKGVADEIGRVLSLPEAERAGAVAELLGKIDTLVPDDPAMAEVIADQMREAFSQQMAKQPDGNAPAENRAIPN